jgi:8-oxo-dGTP pyrophosphatase MutT (NUDIX family)
MYIPENGGELYLSGQLIIDTPQPLKRGGVKVDEKTTVVGGTLADLLRHEIGHSLEEAVGRLISVDKVFAANKDSISKELSTYASLNPKEWIAESFSAYSHQDYGKSGVRVNPLLEKAFDRITGVDTRDGVHVHDDWVESKHKRSKGGQFGSGAAHFKEGDPDPPDLHGVPFKPFKPPADWSKVEGQADISEPPLNSKGKKVGAGLLMREPDGRVWIIKPTNAYGGYEYTFPKGGREKGHSLQATAIKEAFEESGLKGRIVGHAGDYEGDTSMTRYYHAVREGGTPTGHGWESEGVSLVPHHQLHAFLNRGRDRKIASEHLMPPKVHDAWEESKIHRGQPGNAGQFAKGEGTPHHAAVKKAVAAAEAPAPEHGILSATVNKHIHKAALEAGYEPVEGKPLEYEKKEPYGERIIARPGGYWTVHSASHGSPVTGKGGQSLAAFLKGEVGPESGYKVPQVKQAAAAKSAASRELSRMIYRGQAQHIVDTKAERTMDKPGGTLEPHDMHAVASIVGKWMGYHNGDGDPRPITVKSGIQTFMLGGKEQKYAGGANLKTGEISLYHEVLSADFTASCTAHEIMHQQFETVLLAYRAERDKATPDPRRYSHKAEFEKDYPLYTELDKYLRADDLAVDDGLTPYSKQWWDEWHKGSASTSNTIHETMAEMARLDWEGTLPRLLWYKNSKTWGPLYDAVRRLYPEVVKR